MCAPMFLTQVAMLLKSDFLGNAGRRISPWPFFPFLSIEGRVLGFLIWLALLMGTYAFNSFQQSQKRVHVQRRHAFLDTYAAHEPLAQPPGTDSSQVWCWHLRVGCSRSMASE
jgi:hypothetical protein